jgi:hypothetical protein
MKEITLATPTRVGLLADISDALGRAGISMETLDAVTVRDWDVVRLTCTDYPRALQILRAAGLDPIAEDGIVIHLKDEPGSLAKVTRRLQDAGIVLRSARILHRKDGTAMVALAIDRGPEGLALIADLLVDRGFG